jgi:hypothetical protein
MQKSNFSFQRLFSLKNLALFLSFFILMVTVGLIGYTIGLNQTQTKLDDEHQENLLLKEKIKKSATTETQADVLQECEVKKHEDEIRHLKEKFKKICVEKKMVEANHEYAPKDKNALPPKAEIKVLPKSKPSTAKLVIIMDDISYARDVKAVHSLGLPLILSFLPPSPCHPESAKLAAKERSYMVHFPMQAVAFNDEEPDTLHVGDSEEKIAARIVQLKHLYPKARYMNNHTGSKFTSDKESMEKLLPLLKKEGIIFVDSRTIGTTKIPQVSKELGLRYFGRDVFLDDRDGVENIKKQIREAVAMAKRHGTAIAIGHPRPDTLEALRQSKELLGEVRLVGIDSI